MCTIFLGVLNDPDGLKEGKCFSILEWLYHRDFLQIAFPNLMPNLNQWQPMYVLCRARLGNVEASFTCSLLFFWVYTN